MQSPQFNWNLTDTKKWIVNAAIMAAAAFLTLLIDNVGQLQLDKEVEVFVAGALALGLKAFQYLVRGPSVAILVGAMLLLCSQAVMAEALVVDAGNKPGIYFLRVTVGADGTATITPITKVVSLTDPAPGPVPPGPAPVVMTERAKVVKAAADKVQGDPNREATAQALAALYRECAKRAKVGEIDTSDNLLKMLRMSTDLLLSQTGAPPASWQPVRDAVSVQWATVAAKGGGVGDYATLLDEVANGLDASAPNKAIDPQMMAMILEIIKIVLQLLIK